MSSTPATSAPASFSRVAVVIVAGGTGNRFGASLPKQYCLLDGKPVLAHTLEAFRSALPGARIVTVVSREMEDFWRVMCKEALDIDPGELVHGGSSRWESTGNALDTLDPADFDIVLVHDGARPLPSPSLIRAVIEKASDHDVDGAVPAVAVTDTLRLITDPSTGTSSAVDRSLYRAVQTPQGFRLADLKRAFALPWRPDFTDEASVMTIAGMNRIAMVEGSPFNIKITHPADIEIASVYLRHIASPATDR
ncbi:MAG: 2-C-methyl-D-erythritol 4-phosphate cytidylyltransferase [Muribaculaceae bacterium]|nr:2-C-methyl-D-erythritol 4-phosphate cytidylyltransferase [Muribaculaceae bacterium]